MKIISPFSLVAGGLCLLLFNACNSRKQAPQQAPNDTTQVSQAVAHVVGLGKVEPMDGIIELASEVSGVVKELHKKDGDTVRKGEIILVLSQTNQQLKIQEIQKQIEAAQQTVLASQASVQQNELRLQRAQQQVSTGKRLLSSGGETGDQVAQLETEARIVKEQLRQTKTEVAEARAKQAELEAQLASARYDQANRLVKAPRDGILLSMNANQGEALNALQRYAILAPSGPLVIRGEVDELYASLLKLNQQVNIHLVGHGLILATGKIIFLSPGLNDKSIFAEVPGEAQDRRVRRFKVLLDSSDLLINTKVSCDILLN